MLKSKTENTQERVLFLGRHDCAATQQLLDLLKKADFDVTQLLSKKRGETIPEHILQWNGEFIISYRSLFIVPPKLLLNATIAAINFHPGPPEYPGSGCINFAIYEGAKSFGVTAHTMDKKIDSGKILEVRRFEIKDSENLSDVLSKTHKTLFELCSDFINSLAVDGQKFIEKKHTANQKQKWSGSQRTISDLETLQEISPSISKEELNRVIRATHLDDFPKKFGYTATHLNSKNNVSLYLNFSKENL